VTPILLSKDINFKIYRLIILPVVLYGCESWSLTLRMRVSDKRALRRIFMPNRDKVIGEG
jgi:hypothetical protein